MLVYCNSCTGIYIKNIGTKLYLYSITTLLVFENIQYKFDNLTKWKQKNSNNTNTSFH